MLGINLELDVGRLKELANPDPAVGRKNRIKSFDLGKL